MDQQIEKVNQYYEATVIDYHTLWTGKKDLAIHFGYYDSGVNSHSASLIRMNEILAQYAKITKKDRVLDAGCGYGGSAIWLANNIGCKVVGVNVVPFQIDKAKNFAQKKSVADFVSFYNEDYTHTSFPSESFDVVWALESVVHASDKAKVIAEFSRLLRPGGRLIMAEYTPRESPVLSREEYDFMKPWLDGWAMPSLLTVPEYKELLETSGLANVVTHNITKQVIPSLKRLNRRLRIGFPIGQLFYRIGIFSKAHFGNIEGTKIQMASLKKGYWQYTVLIAQKI